MIMQEFFPHLYLLNPLPPCVLLRQANSRNVQIGLWGFGNSVVSRREVEGSDAHGGRGSSGHVGFTDHLWRLEPLEPEQSLSAGGGRGRLRLGALEHAVAHAQAAVGAADFAGPDRVLLGLCCMGRGRRRGLDGGEDGRFGHGHLGLGWT